MPFPFCQEQAFYRDAPEEGQIDRVGILNAVPEATARGNQRILQPQRADLN
jgi:hypothetical protein